MHHPEFWLNKTPGMQLSPQLEVKRIPKWRYCNSFKPCFFFLLLFLAIDETYIAVGDEKHIIAPNPTRNRGQLGLSLLLLLSAFSATHMGIL